MEEGRTCLVPCAGIVISRHLCQLMRHTEHCLEPPCSRSVRSVNPTRQLGVKQSALLLMRDSAIIRQTQLKLGQHGTPLPSQTRGSHGTHILIHADWSNSQGTKKRPAYPEYLETLTTPAPGQPCLPGPSGGYWKPREAALGCLRGQRWAPAAGELQRKLHGSSGRTDASAHPRLQ